MSLLLLSEEMRPARFAVLRLESQDLRLNTERLALHERAASAGVSAATFCQHPLDLSTLRSPDRNAGREVAEEECCGWTRR
jgi:hypothetical protein